MERDNVNENVDALASLHARAEQGVSSHQRRIELVTAGVGRPRSIYMSLALTAAWIGLNLAIGALGGHAPDPPPFSWLQGAVGLGALLMTIMVLTTQNRQTHQREQHAQLELQVSLLSEQKVAKLIDLLEELRRDLPIVHNRVDQMAEVMKQPVDPHAVLSALEHTLDTRDATEPASRTIATPGPEGRGGGTGR